MAINCDHDARLNAGSLLDPRQERKQPVVDAAPAADPRGIDMLRPVRRESRDRGVGVWRAAQIVAVERDDARIVAQPRRHAVEGRARHAARLRLGPISAERSVGKERVSTCRARGSPYQYKKKI